MARVRRPLRPSSRPMAAAPALLLAAALALGPVAVRAGEAQFRDTIRDILADVMGTDLPPDQLHALQNCSINAFSALTPDQKQGLVDAGRANGDQYLDQLDQDDANPPAFAAAVHCFELLKAETLVGSPEAQEPAPAP
ncbi:MAG: hypothetical protein IRY94_03045 [Rhodospirillaceae bacterium]|nr:hypothetical protein [Rhodospirillaceae bacterium]